MREACGAPESVLEGCLRERDARVWERDESDCERASGEIVCVKEKTVGEGEKSPCEGDLGEGVCVNGMRVREKNE